MMEKFRICCMRLKMIIPSKVAVSQSADSSRF
jgi:hypothetical protein